MKKYLSFAAALLTLAACNKAQADINAPAVPAEDRAQAARLCVNIAGTPGTKADIQTADEAKVNSLQVFVFNEDQIDVYGSVANAKSITLDATTGDRTVWAVVNAPDLSAVKTMSELKASVSQFTRNTSSNFVMVGSTAATLTAQSDISIAVDRIAARVVLGKVTRAFNAAGLAALPADKFEIVRVYMCDVVADQKYDLTKTAYDAWLSSSLKDGAIATANNLLYNKPAQAPTLAQSASHEYNQSLYVYPNGTVEDTQNARITRLVLECKINGAFYTYPVLLGMGIQNNKSYEIRELVLTRLGNPSNGDDKIDAGENDPIESVNIPFGIEVNDWDVVLVGDEGTITI